MSTHDREELEREGRMVRDHTRASLMSDTKWRKLLGALDRPGMTLDWCVVKFVGRCDERMIRRPTGLYPPRPWIDAFGFGPIPLRSIEWLLLPRQAKLPDFDRTSPAKYVTQDVELAASIVGERGRYPTELSERGLLIRGYLPSPLAL